MNILENINLASFTTFMVQAKSRYFVSIVDPDDVALLVADPLWVSTQHYFLGSGSNTLFISDYDGLVVVNQITGLEVLDDTEDSITIRVGGGESWHHLVEWAIDQNLWGIENLALVPGTVGAAPVQNIGAYGVEAKDTIVLVEVYDTLDKCSKTFTNTECSFGYRTSMFKEHPGRYFITHVHFRLSKFGTPKLSYPKIQETLDARGVSEYTPLAIAEAIIEIRDSKLPRVGVLGTAGSFFENPVVDKELAVKLLERFPDMVQFPTSDESRVKLSAAWLIEYCGFKGIRDGSVGTYEKHALVLVNHGGARGEEVWSFARSIIDKVYATFKVELHPEVQILGEGL